jgi:RNA polymerase sigma factor (sigma-70 family)
LLSANDNPTWDSLCRKLRFQAYLFLLKAGTDHYEAYERANDFAQETCLAIFKGRYPGDVPHTAWAQRILHNKIIQRVTRSPDLLDQPKLTVPLQSDDGPDYAELKDSLTVDFAKKLENQETLEWALGQLPSDAQREVLRRKLDGWSDKEIAVHLGRSVQAVYNLQHRALRGIRQLIDRLP